MQNLILSASFDKDGEDPPGVSTGILSLVNRTWTWRAKPKPCWFASR